MTLFDKHAPNIKRISVVKRFAAARGWDFTYTIINTMNSVAELKDQLENWHRELLDYLDKDFVEKTKIDFHQRIWELYCGKLLNQRFNLIKKPIKSGLPDFLFEKEGEPTWLEATAPENGSEADGNKLLLLREELAKKGFIGYGGLINVRTDPVVLRLKAAIEKKYQNKLPIYLKSGMGEGQPFILAVNSHLFDDGMHSDQIILQLFFGMGNQVVIFGKDPQESKTNEVLREDRKEAASLKGVNVSVGMFCSKQYEYISGIIFTPKDIYNLERTDMEIGKDIFYIGNPYAKNPVSSEVFSFCTRVTEEGGGVKFEKPD